MGQPIKAIVGLGNPGPRYLETRHNAGFWLVDALAMRDGAHWRNESRFHGELAETRFGGQKCWLLKPDCFMNCSGRSVLALAQYYKLDPDELLVVYDELDLPPGIARFKSGGGHGGHNGLRDIFSCLGSREFNRLRLGIGHPGDKSQVSDYVLTRPGREQRELMLDAIGDALQVIDAFAAGQRQQATTRLHSTPGQDTKPATKPE
jgi:PTH1 family peptidyl-tRNA hydrolase